MSNKTWRRARRLVAAALIAAGALGVAGVGLATSTSTDRSVAVECPPEKERC